MPNVTPTDALSLAASTLRLTIADSATFRTWTNSANQAAALAKIFSGSAPAGTTAPFAVIEGPVDRWARDGGGARERWVGTAELVVRFRGSAPTEADSWDARFEFLNKVGAIARELRALFGRVGYFDADAWEALSPGPVRPTRTERVTAVGDYYELAFRAVTALVEQ